MKLSEKDQKKKAKEFSLEWENRGYEKGDSQPFWMSLLRDVYGVEKPEQYIRFEDQVKLDHTSFIDGCIDETHVMIEQKGIDKDLNTAIRQSDGSLLTPFQQAKRYSSELPYSKRPRWIITCNFKEFYIYDMEKPNGDPSIVKLKDLPKECYRMNFLVDVKDNHIEEEKEVSFKAGELVGVLYDAFSKQYKNIDTDTKEQQSLNKLIVRIVFCLYAEDAEIFGKRNMFHDYLAKFDAPNTRNALIKLFKILDQKTENRDQYEDSDLLAFPYVNGGLFTEEDIVIPTITDEIRDLLLSKASDDFDWSKISPTIFGAVFESTLNPETRRTGGMHYTSIENIHKVIDPLFLDDLKEELEKIKNSKDSIKTRLNKVREFQSKLCSLKFLDPACGSGNFLTETYISIRKLENEAIRLEQEGMVNLFDPIRVSIAQFFGIEINDFAVTVAKTALWIAESQMMKETEDICSVELEFLPLTTNAFIVEDNAIRCNWNLVASADELSYIIGNPPFSGYLYQTEEQKKDIKLMFPNNKKAGNLDYVSCWYKKALDMMHQNKNIKTALVSTNSITQGEQVSILWNELFEEGAIINFAYRTFRWDSEASIKAHVHCVIIGFSLNKENEYRIFDNGTVEKAKNINGYLLDAPNISITKTSKPLCKVPKMQKGSQLIDGGNFMVGERREYESVIKEYPEIKQYIKKYLNAQIFLNRNKELYVLDLNNCNPTIIKNNKYLYKKVDDVKKYRETESDFSRSLSDIPSKYYQYISPQNNSIIIPQASSEKRRYIPMGFSEKGYIYTNQLLFIDDAELYHFSILESNVHMLWMRTVAGRLKSDYRYSKDIVYNNFPWPEFTEESKQEMKKSAQAILDARALYPNSSLADLYNDLSMPVELRKAHQENDRIVMKAYNLTKIVDGKKTWLSEAETVSKLFDMYEQLTKEKD